MPTQTGSYDFIAASYSNTSYTQFSNSVTAGTSGVKRYTLLMRDSNTTWSSFVNQANSTATTKTVSTGGYILSKLIYSAGGSEYSSGSATSTVYDAYPFDFRYSSNCGNTLTANQPVYLVGTVNENGLFYFDTTNWYTQTAPTTEDGKTYIYVGNAYSAYQVWLATENTAYRFYNGEFRPLEEVQSIIQTENINDRIDTEVENINNNITGALTSLDASLDQEEILNRLTNYSDQEGLFVENGKVYVRASYIKSDALTLGGANNQYGTFVMKDENDNNIAVWDRSGLRTDWFNFQSDSQSAYIGRGDSSGIRNVYIDNDSIDIRDGQTVLASFGEETKIGRAFGETGNPLAHLDISGDRMSFKVGNDEVAYISVDEDTLESLFYMTKAIVVQDLHFGNWQWRGRKNGNLSLKWIGSIDSEGDTGSTGT